MNEQSKALLRRTTLFGALSDESLTRLAAQSQFRSYKRGQLLFCQGDAGDWIYVVAEGLVKLVRTSSQGNELLLGLRRPPHIFGEIAILDGRERAATAEAMCTPTRVLVVNKQPVTALLDESTALSRELAVNFGALLREAIERAFDFVFLDLKGRVAKVLIEFADTVGQRTDEGTLIDVQLHQADVAAIVGGTRPAVNKVLKDLERRGYLRLQGRTIVLLQPEQLVRRAES